MNNDIQKCDTEKSSIQKNIDTLLFEKQNGKEVTNSIVKDTLLKINNEQLYEQISIIVIENKFVSNEIFDDYGKHVVHTPDNQVKIVINEESFIFAKQDIPQLDKTFIQQSLFQNVFFKEISSKKSTFEIIFGIPDSDNIVLIYLSINDKGEKEIEIEYLEEEE